MAGDLIATDAMFPDYRPGIDTDAYLRENNNYLFLLKESLNYTLHNLGVANFNARQLQTISDIITKPIMMALVGEDGQLTSIQADLDGIKTTVGTVEGNVSTIQQTVKGLSSRVTNVEGQYSSLSQTVSGFETTVTNINNNYISKSSATQSASGFKFEVMDSNHSNALVTLDKSGLTIKGGGILIKNSTNQEVLKADTNGDLTLTGTVDSSAIFGSAIVTCSKDDYNAAANGSGYASFIQISDTMIKSFYGNQTYGFQCAAVGSASYFSLDYAGAEKFRVKYESTTDATEIRAASYLSIVSLNEISIRTSRSIALGIHDANIIIQGNGVYVSGVLYVNGKLVAN